MNSPNNLDLFDDLEEVPIGGPKTGIVVVIVANFLVGALLLTLACVMITTGRPPVAIMMLEEVMGSAKLGETETHRSVQLDEAQTARLFRYLRPVASAITTMVGIPFGVLCLVAGIGTTLRRAWGRLLSLVLGGMAVLVALAAVPILDVPGVILYGSYTLLTLLILRDKDYARQFT